jgi:hypothetical protein
MLMLNSFVADLFPRLYFFSATIFLLSASVFAIFVQVSFSKYAKAITWAARAAIATLNLQKAAQAPASHATIPVPVATQPAAAILYKWEAITTSAAASAAAFANLFYNSD